MAQGIRRKGPGGRAKERISGVRRPGATLSEPRSGRTKAGTKRASSSRQADAARAAARAFLCPLRRMPYAIYRQMWSEFGQRIPGSVFIAINIFAQ